MSRLVINIGVFVMLILSLSSCGSIYRFMRYGPPQITDHERFIKLPIEASSEPSKLNASKSNISLPMPSEWALDTKKRPSKKAHKYKSNDEFFEDSETVSFLVMKGDSIIYEKYFNGYTHDKPAQVFSVTKAIIGTLIAIAIKDGDIKGLDQYVSDFLPEFADKSADLRIDHLLQMTSGFNFIDYSIPGVRKLLRMYYIRNQGDYLHKINHRERPGSFFAYSSYASLVLGTCLEKAVGRPVNEYLSEKLWKPMGAKYPAYWTAHKDSVAKMYGGIVTVARDLARFGMLYLNDGRMNGRQIVPREWVVKSRQMDTLNGAWWGYNNCFWLDTYYDGCDKVKNNFKKMNNDYMVKKQKNDFFAGGYKGQTVYLDPKNDIIVVRQGAKRSGFYWSTSISHLVHRVYDNDKKTNASIY